MLVAFENPFTFTFFMFAVALGLNRQPWWTGLLPLPFAWWSSGWAGVVDAALLFAAAYGVAVWWTGRRPA